MKAIMFLLFLILLSCCNNSTSVEEVEKYFNPNDLEKLEIEKYEEFWESHLNNDTIFVKVNNFNFDERILEAIEYNCDSKRIEVIVYSSKEAAMSIMDEIINSVPCVIIEGDSKLMEEKTWWYSACIPNMIIINQWNTITRVSEYHNDFESIKEKLMGTALNIADRVDDISK